MEIERILEIIEDMMLYGKQSEKKAGYNRGLLDLAQKIIEEVDNDDMQMREVRRGEADDQYHYAEGSGGPDQSRPAGGAVPGLSE